jgi:large subunit ribosomal protein L30e
MIKKFESAIPVIVKSGRVVYGVNNVLWSLRNEPDKVKLLVISRNPPIGFLEELESIMGSLGVKIPIVKSTKSNMALGDLCGRPHSVSVMAIYDFGNAAVSGEEFNE